MPDAGKDHLSDRSSRNIHRLVNAALTLLLALCAAAFVLSYQNLIRAVQDERINSVEQIAGLITNRVSQLRASYLREIGQIAQVVEHSDAAGMGDLAYLQTGDNRIALVDEAGTYTLLDGSSLLVDDPELLGQLVHGTEESSTFATIKAQDDYWLFAAPLSDTVIGGKTYIGAVLIVGVQEYADAATITLYDRRGESLVVAQDGTIKMRPSAATDLSFGGYNLLSILQKYDVPQENLTAFSDALSNLKEYSFTCSLDRVIWIIRTDPADGARNIVVAVPVSVTAQSTYQGMNITLILVIAAVAILALLFVLNFEWILRKNQQIQLENARAKSKSDFLDKMSHDIRTPMTAIVGMHELALQSFDDKELVYDCLVKAKKSSSYLVSVVNDVLDMSRIESGKMTLASTPFNLRELLRDVIQMESPMAAEKNVALTEQIDDAVTDFRGDAQRIKQCVVNLVNNAVKFTRPGGFVTLLASAGQAEDGRVWVTIRVRDSGIGMSEEFLQKIFKPFEQEHSSMVSTHTGSGLGLSIVHEFVTLMGGTVSVQSKKDVGSTFTIVLPLETAPAAEAEEAELSDDELRAHLRGRRVLLVEDNALNRQIIGMLLKNLSLEVDEAEDGQIAVDKFSASAPGTYAMIFMDIMMPVMGGLEAASAIRSLGRPDAKTVPIIALSANAFAEDAQKSLDAGMQMHLAKPVDLNALRRVLQKYI